VLGEEAEAGGRAENEAGGNAETGGKAESGGKAETGSCRFFENRGCEYWPCHRLERINCLFCFCPLYTLDCGGNWKLTDGGIKDCSDCLIPHGEGGYDYVIARLSGRKTGSVLG